LLVPPSLATEDFPGLATAIVRYVREHPHGVPPNLVDWLRHERD
jgi:hypothetical protein